MNKYVLTLIIKNTLFIIGLMAFNNGLHAQFHSSVYSDAGKNNTSNGFLIKTAVWGTYSFSNNAVGIGSQIDVMSKRKNSHPGIFLNYSRRIYISDHPLHITGFLLYNKFAVSLYETNRGIFFTSQHPHFYYKLGTNIRTYGLSKNGINKYNIEKPEKIHEYFNIMYTITYYIKPSDFKWNIGISAGNTDYFVINQETNPVFNLQARYQLKKSMLLYVESWYKTAGAYNLSINPFGYFIRTGLAYSIHNK